MILLPDIYIELVFSFGSRLQIDDGQSRRELPRGYADQAHLAREFKHFSHKTPSRFASEMLALREVLRASHHVVFLQDSVDHRC